MTINERFFALLEEKGISQKNFSDKTGISTQTISAWKKRKTDPPASLISTIADFFSITSGYLLTGEGPKYPCSNEEEFSAKQLLEYYNALTDVEKTIILGKTAELYAERRKSLHEDT